MKNIWLADWTESIFYYILHPLQAILVLNAPMSTTLVHVSRTASERPRGETEELSLSRRLLEPSTSLSTGVSNIACSEGSLLETRVKELSALQLERVCSVEEAKFPELQFSCGYALDNNKQILIATNFVTNFAYVFYLSPVISFLVARLRHPSVSLACVFSSTWLPCCKGHETHRGVIDIVYCGGTASLKALLPFDFVNTSAQKPSTLRGHFTHAYRALDTLPNHYY